MRAGEIIGLVGSFLVLIAYYPQISHLIKEKCSAGISRKAFIIWLVSSFMLIIHSVLINDVIFISLQVINFIATAVILVFATKYKNNVCEYHKNMLSSIQID
ncbi:hypothetical protein BH10BAC5_BH10BAC5_25980 [soil metagenome]